MVILSAVTSLFIAVQDTITQKFAARIAGGYLSEKTGAKIKIGKLYIAPNLSIYIGDFYIKDLKDNDLATIGNLRTKFVVQDLLNGKIHIAKAELKDVTANLIKYEGEDEFNFAPIANAFQSSDSVQKKPTEPTELYIDQVALSNVSFQLWKQDQADLQKTLANKMDYSHLVLDNVNLNANDIAIIGDSIHANINKLTAKDLCGFELKDMQGLANVSPSGIIVDGLHLQTNNSQIYMDLKMLFSDFSDLGHFTDSVYFDTRIFPSDIMLSDIGAFATVMYKMPDLVHFETYFTGPIEHFKADDMKIGIGEQTTIEGTLTMHPQDFKDGMHTLNISKMHYTYDDLVNFYIPSKSITIPLPESLKGMGSGNITLNFKGSYNDFLANANITSGIGDIIASFNMDQQGSNGNAFSGKVKAKRIDIGTIANASDFVGSIDLNAEIAGRKKPKGNMEFDINGEASNAYVLDNTIDKIKLNGRLTDKRFNGKISIKDDELDLDFNGLADFNTKKPHGDFSAIVNKADLRSLNIIKSDSLSILNTEITADFVGFDLDEIEGSLSLDNTHYTDSRGNYNMEHFDANIVNDKLLKRRININCDFFTFQMAGLMNFASLPNAVKIYLDSYTNIPKWDNDIQKYLKIKDKKEQDFIIDLNINDPNTITRLLLPQLQLANNTTLNGTFTSRTNTLNMTLRSKGAKFNNIIINEFEYKQLTYPRSTIARFNIDEIILRDSTEHDSARLCLENFVFENTLKSDTVFANLRWNDQESQNNSRADIKTIFNPTETGGRFNIKSAELLINDSVWSINPSNSIVFDDDRISIQNLEISHNEQRFAIDGHVPYYKNDTINAYFNGFNLSTFNLIFKGMGFDLDGIIDGNAQVSDLKGNPSILANLGIDDFMFNGNKMGDLRVNSYWDYLNNSIFLETSIVNLGKPTFTLSGFYNTEKKEDNLDFNLKLDSLELGSLSNFTQGIVSRIRGLGNGGFTIKGSIQKPVIEGELSIEDGGCQIEYLKTFYTFSPTIRLSENEIELSNMVLTDTLGHSARVVGNIKHKNLKDFDLNITLLPENFLVLATTFKDDPNYYGTAITNGIVEIKGSTNDIKLKIKALTRQGTKITIPLNNSSTVKENDFITFVPAPGTEAESTELDIPKKKAKSNLGLNLDIDLTNEAKVKILLPSDFGTLEATGSGNIKISSNPSENLTLFGEYQIDDGRLQINYGNIISKNLKLQKGGTISWVGDPAQGSINVTGVYSTTAPLSSLGIVIDSTSSQFNNVNVECLIHLSNSLTNPNISFGIRFPNTTEDTRNAIFTILDTTNQAAMTQQAISLLILNSFSNVQASTYFTGGTAYFDVVTNQLTNWISQISQNFDVGIHYKPGDRLSSEQLQIAMKTQLFDNRLTIETNFGMVNSTNTAASNASNIVGEFDIYWKISKEGKLQLHAYNHSNSNNYLYDYTFDRLSPYTQGLGISYSHSFNKLRDIFKKKRTLVPERPFTEKTNTTKQ